MASLKNLGSNEIIILNSYHQFGRSPQNNTLVVDNDVSRKHAAISWEESVWKITDYSKNGTIVDSRIICHTSKEIRNKCKIQFGSSKSTLWEVLSTNPPCSYLESKGSPGKFIELTSTLIWPNEDNPQISLFKSSPTIWSVDTGSQITELKTGTLLSLDDEVYEFRENELLNSTFDMNDITGYACFVFSVSPDGESIRVKIVINELQLDLGERVYNHVLYWLAQQRLADEENGVSPERVGWVMMSEMITHLSKELLLEVDEYYLNVQIHRLRKKLIELPPYGYCFANVIERKNGELRFNHLNFKIENEVSNNVVAPTNIIQ